MTEDIFKQEMLPGEKPNEIPIIPSANGATLINGSLSSPNYAKDRSGWNIDAEGDAEFDDIKARGNMERNDFHWTTFFESLDGYSVTDGVSIAGTGVTITTDGSGINTDYMTKLPAYNFNILSWNKDRKIRTHIKFDTNTNQTIELVSGLAGADNHIGFKVTDGTLYGTCGNSDGAGSQTTLSLGAISTAAAGMSLEVNYRAGKSATFIVDGVDLGTITSDLPTGIGSAARLMYFEITEAEAVAKSFKFSFYDIWQGV